MQHGDHKLLRSIRTVCLAVVLAALVLIGTRSGFCQSSTAVRIAVVKSLDLPEYNLAYEGFISAVRASGYRAETLPFTLTRDSQSTEATCRAIKDAAPDMILALGTRAAREIAGQEKDIPIVYAMVLAMPDDSQEKPSLQSQKNVTGATLNIPLETQLDDIQKVFPDVRHIGIISNPSKTKRIVESARFMAESRGLSLHVAWATNEQDVPTALRQLRDSIEVLWMIPDATVLTPRSSRYIIFELIKSGIPVIGLSAAYVKAGAVMALDCDYEDIGRQSGELASRILGGQSPAGLPETAPRLYTRALNLKIREHLRVQMDESVIGDSNVVIY